MDELIGVNQALLRSYAPLVAELEKVSSRCRQAEAALAAHQHVSDQENVEPSNTELDVALDEQVDEAEQPQQPHLYWLHDPPPQ